MKHVSFYFYNPGQARKSVFPATLLYTPTILSSGVLAFHLMKDVSSSNTNQPLLMHFATGHPWGTTELDADPLPRTDHHPGALRLPTPLTPHSPEWQNCQSMQERSQFITEWKPGSLLFGLGFNSQICIDIILIIGFSLLFRKVEEKLGMHINLSVKMQSNPFS